MDIHANILLEINVLECEEYKYGLSKNKSKRLTYLRTMEKQFRNILRTAIISEVRKKIK